MRNSQRKQICFFSEESKLSSCNNQNNLKKGQPAFCFSLEQNKEWGGNIKKSKFCQYMKWMLLKIRGLVFSLFQQGLVGLCASAATQGSSALEGRGDSLRGLSNSLMSSYHSLICQFGSIQSYKCSLSHNNQ